MSFSLDILAGADIWNVERTHEELIQGVLWDGDVVMLLGSEKAGKSILGLQMAFCLTSGTPFLDKYTVPNPVSVLYIQTEGKESEMVDTRMRNMQNTIDLDETKFSRIFQHFLPLDSKDAMDALITGIKYMDRPPRVIIIDSLYTSMEGDLNENHAVRTFISSVSRLLSECNATLVIIHHETKEQWESGKMVERGDRGSYGSVFLRAWVSHILYLKKHPDKSRTLTCDTQRSGSVIEREELLMLEPNPLCFQIKGDYAPYVELVWRHLRDGATCEELMERTNLSRSSVAKGLRQLLKVERVTKTATYPRVYTAIGPVDGRLPK